MYIYMAESQIYLQQFIMRNKKQVSLGIENKLNQSTNTYLRGWVQK